MRSLTAGRCQCVGHGRSAVYNRSGALVIEAKQRVAPKVQQNHKKTNANLGVDHEKLYSDAGYEPPAQHGSIKIQNLPGVWGIQESLNHVLHRLGGLENNRRWTVALELAYALTNWLVMLYQCAYKQCLGRRQGSRTCDHR